MVYLRGVIARQATVLPVMGMGGWLHTQLGLGTKNDSRLVLSAADLQLAAATVRHLELGAPIQRKEKPRHGQAAELAAGAGEGYRRRSDLAWQQHLIAVVPLNLGMAHAGAARFLAAQWQDVLRWEFDEILACQTMAALGNIQRCSWLFGHHYPKGTKVLAVFTGDMLTSFKPAAAATLIGSTVQPVSALVSHDPFGLRAASKLPRVDRICLPPSAQLSLAPRMDPRTLNSRIERVGEHLDRCRHRPVQECWKQIKATRVAVDIRDLVAA